MNTKDPKSKEAAAKCPDCGKVSPLAQLLALAMAVPGFGTFLDCPRCAVGSPVRSWRAAKSL